MDATLQPQASPRTASAEDAIRVLDALRRTGPLVHCMTNIVVAGFTANVLLAVGESYAVARNRPHKITPHGERSCRFLLVQGVGQYDRHPIDPATWKR